MKILIVGASKGLGRALAEGLGQDAEMIIGVSRKTPTDLTVAPSCASGVVRGVGSVRVTAPF